MCPLSRSLQQMWLADNNEVVPSGLIDSDWGGTPIEAWSVVTHTIPQLVQRSDHAELQRRLPPPLPAPALQYHDPAFEQDSS